MVSKAPAMGGHGRSRPERGDQATMDNDARWDISCFRCGEGGSERDEQRDKKESSLKKKRL